MATPAPYRVLCQSPEQGVSDPNLSWLKAEIRIAFHALSFQWVIGIFRWHISCEGLAPLEGDIAMRVSVSSRSPIMDKPTSSNIHNTCPVPPEDSVGSSEARLLTAKPMAVRGGLVAGTRHQRILLATASQEVELAVLPIIRALDARVVQVKDAMGLAKALHERGTFDLVLSDSHLPGGTGLGILAIARQSGQRPPFIVVQSVHQSLIRVAVGGGSRGVLATRVVNDVALIELAEDLLGLHDTPASSRHPFTKDALG
jgi:CheY-like chemotaxis protein